MANYLSQISNEEILTQTRFCIEMIDNEASIVTYGKATNVFELQDWINGTCNCSEFLEDFPNAEKYVPAIMARLFKKLL